MSKIIHFEINADDPERAVKFYRDVFGWDISKWGPEDYWLCTTGPESEPGIHGAISRRMGSGQPTVNTISVDSLEAAAAQVEASGGKVISPQQTIPGVGYFRYCEDPEGNRFGILQPNREAQ